MLEAYSRLFDIFVNNCDVDERCGFYTNARFLINKNYFTNSVKLLQRYAIFFSDATKTFAQKRMDAFALAAFSMFDLTIIILY